MKKILLILSVVCAFASANAQWSGHVSNCIPSPLSNPGFPAPDSIPCAIQGQTTDITIPFQMFTSFTYLGQHNIDSVTFDTVYNFPCGLTWSLNKASKTYLANENGCFEIKGVTNDAVGQYNLRVALTAYLSGAGGVGEPIGPNTVDAAGIKIWFRVASASGSCAGVDTSQSATDQVSASPCTVGINEVEANVSSLTVLPNPMASSALVSFTSQNGAHYTLKVTDITGKVIMQNTINAIAGVNTYTIERGNMANGLYLLSLTDGTSSITKKFAVAE